MLMRFVLKVSATFVLLFVSVGVFASGNDSLYAQRLRKIDSMGIGYHPWAADFIADYLHSPKETAEALGRYQHYKPYIDSVLKTYGLPSQVGILMLALSGADCFHKNENGNCGPWDLQYRVARMYGLKMNTYVDERMDFEQTTQLSARYLKELYVIYNSWPMAMAAFSTNTLTLNKFIRQSGNTFNYWDMYDSLPAEAQKIVPAYIGALYIYNYASQHNITPKPFKTLAYDTVRMTQWMSFDVLAPALHTTVGALQSLNPIFKKGVVPHSVRPYLLKIPQSSRPWMGSIDSLEFEPYNTNPYVEEVPELADKNLPKPKEEEIHSNAADTIVHVVAKGEGLGVIAQKYGVKVDDIRKWNNLKNYTIFPNQKLKIVRKKD